MSDIDIVIGKVNLPLNGYVNIKCDRTTALGNPYIMGVNGLKPTRNEVCEDYKKYLRIQIKKGNPKIIDALSIIYNAVKAGNKVNLQCWCAPHRCHCETIRDVVINAFKKTSNKLHVCIAGSRSFNNYQDLKDTVNAFIEEANPDNKQIVIVSGGANGADNLGERYAHEYAYEVNLMQANWDEYGLSAGYKRNVEMADVADLVLIFWDGVSKGTKHMIDICTSKNVPFKLFKY